MVKVLKMSTGFVWLGSSVVECTHGKRKTLGSNPDLATFFFRPCDIWWPMCGDQFVTGRFLWLGNSVVECSHGKRDTLVRVPVGPHSFSARVTQYRTDDNYYEYNHPNANTKRCTNATIYE